MKIRKILFFIETLFESYKFFILNKISRISNLALEDDEFDFNFTPIG